MEDTFNPREESSLREKDFDGKIRPREFTEFAGQEKILDNLKVFVKAALLRGEALDHVLFHGPPGLGKTTLASIVANELGVNMKITSGPVLDKPGDLAGLLTSLESGDVLFIDEIHRFSKSQQDSLLGAVEKGVVTLIGATTENPSFEVISALLSRCQVYVLKEFGEAEMRQLLDSAIQYYAKQGRKVSVQEAEALFRISGGDARKLLNAVELVVNNSPEGLVVIDNARTTQVIQQNLAFYDKQGEMHYDIISAFIKSMRGSDPNAAVYWLGRMIEGGEDPAFIARRLVISASEDIGLANPNAMLLANAAFDAVMKIGWPEGRIPLAEATIYLATSPKSNSAYMAINDAIQCVKQTGNQPVPLHLRNAPTELMEQLGYHEGYKYPHDYPGHYVDQQYLPDALKDREFWHPQPNPAEDKLARIPKKMKG